jgi:hypothetical protein
MHAPEWVCNELYRLHPQVRLGWVGQDRSGPDDELNKGKFALIQLYAVRDSERTYFGDAWNDRGPIFGKTYDRLFRIPRILELIEPEDVFSGKIVMLLKRWMTPIKNRVTDSRREKGRKYKAQLDDLAGAMGEELYWKGQHATSRPPVVANKFLSDKEKAIINGDVPSKISENTYTEMPANAQPME